MHNKLFLLSLLIGGAAFAQKGGGGGGSTPPGLAEVRAFNEKVPAGGTVQVKFSLTQVRPITTGGPTMPRSGGVPRGAAISSVLGDAAGVALDKDGASVISVISPNSDFGAALDYPFITVTMALPASMAAGTTIPLGFPDTVVQSANGPLTLSVTKPGTLIIGGSLSIDRVSPGGGSWPTGTIIHLYGSGFQAGTKIVTKMKTSRPTMISGNEIQFALAEAVAMDMQPITASNPDGSVVTYYSYLRGVPVSVPARRLLQSTDPIFQSQTHSSASFAVPASGGGQFSALAFQNPNASSVAITLTNSRSGVNAFLVLPSLGRLMDDLQSLLGSADVLAGDSITVTATAPIQILGIKGDESAVTVTPFLPVF